MIKKTLIFIFFTLLTDGLLAQNYPYKKILNHLIKSGEGVQSDNWEKEKASIVFNKIFENDSAGIYDFCLDADHSYWFLLLKNKNRYQILNCNDINTEWPIIDKIFRTSAVNINCQKMSSIIWLYVLNSNQHQTPPMPDLIKEKDPSKKPIKRKYPPRKIVDTEPFYFTKE